MFGTKKESEKELKDDFYKLITENTNDLISITKFNLKAETVFANSSYEITLGYKPKELVGQTGFLLVHPDDKKKLMPLLLKYLKQKAKLFTNKNAGRVHEKVEFRLHDKQGNWHNFESTVNAVGDYFIFISTDVTEKKMMESEIMIQKNFSDDIINSLPGIFYLITKEGRYERWNKNFEKVTGYSAEEIKQMTPLDLFAEDEKHIPANALKDVFNNKDVYVEANLLLKNGKKIPYYFNGKKINFADKSYLVGLGIDITKQKAAEKELREKNENLEKMNKVIVNRELKMIELKNKLKQE